MKAIIKTGGKQYTVSKGDKLNIEKIDGKEGSAVSFKPIAVIDGDKIDTKPKANVSGKIVEQFKDDKKIVFKFKRRKNYKVKNGHRQNLTRIEITKIGG